MKQGLPRVLRIRSGFVFGLALIVAVLVAPNEGRAASATLIFEDVCDDPSNIFDHQWSTDNFNAPDLYFMAGDGSVVSVSQGIGNINNYEDLYVFAHGGNDDIGGMTYANFVAGLEAAHPAAPNSVFFGVCYSATGNDTLLKQVNDEYGENVNKLTGSDGACSLTGNGSRALNNAVYRVGAVRKNQHDENEYDEIVNDITDIWKNGLYPESNLTYDAYCRAALASFNAAALRAFMATVVTNFSQLNSDIDYLKLVELNTGGQALTSCGQDPTNTGEVPCP